MSVSIWKNTAVLAWKGNPSEGILFFPIVFSNFCFRFMVYFWQCSHLFHCNVNRPEPGSVHSEEADQVGPVVHHRDVHLDNAI